jgi:TonB family protein
MGGFLNPERISLNPERISLPDKGADAERKRRSFALVLSVTLHVSALLFFCWPTTPIFVKPNMLARGEGGSSAPAAVALYLPPDLPSQTEHQAKLSLPVLRQLQKSKAKARKRHNVLEQEAAGLREIGSLDGSAAEGSTYGDEVKPALPVTFSDPQISPWDAPSGVQGDVIVEITIDTTGKVSETRLLHGLGPGIDEKVMAAAREWHFRPATRNGIAVPSKQDYRFHFPS